MRNKNCQCVPGPHIKYDRTKTMTAPGVEPGLSRPQRDVLTTRRCGPCVWLVAGVSCAIDTGVIGTGFANTVRTFLADRCPCLRKWQNPFAENARKEIRNEEAWKEKWQQWKETENEFHKIRNESKPNTEFWSEFAGHATRKHIQCTQFKFIRTDAIMTPVGFEPTPLRTGALSQRLRPLGQSVLREWAKNYALQHVKWLDLQLRQ